jgi:NAD(P)H dehydrogenase (quinone)
LRDLYSLGFNPLLSEDEWVAGDLAGVPSDVRHELDLAREAGVVTFINPIWFGAPPAIIVGYFDRIFGAASRRVDFHTPSMSPFAGKRLVVITTSGASRAWLEERGLRDSFRGNYGGYLEAVMGFEKSEHYHAGEVFDGMKPTRAAAIILEIREFAQKIGASLGSAPASAVLDKR